MGGMGDPGDGGDGQGVAVALGAALPAHGFWESPVIVGVSGGGDSVALLLGLLEVAPKGSAPRIVVAHAHHGLRAAADGDLAFVEALASRLGLPAVVARLPVAAGDGVRGEGLEARARRMRYRWLGDAAHAAGARHVVVAHSADDQAETILHRALRGTGLAGLAGMRPARRLVDGVALLRPLLGTRRAALRAYLRARGEAWREDESNADPSHARSFLRGEILPRVEGAAWPGATAALLRLGEQAGAVGAALASAAGHLLERHSRPVAGGTSLDAAALGGLDAALRAAVVAEVWRRHDWPRRDMTAAHYRAVAELLAAAGGGPEDGGPIDLPGGVRAAAAGTWVGIVRR
jgi:tRNA(Ile)-lysidine synthase